MSWSNLVNNIQKFFSCFSCCYKRHIDKHKKENIHVSFTLPRERFYYSTYTNIIVNDVSYPVYKCYSDTQSQYIKINNAYLKV
jgi:hypothetical protein